MAPRVALALLLAALPAVAQPGGEPGDPAVHDGPGLAILVHHPYPDASDPFGFPWPGEGDPDTFRARMRHIDRDGDGFAFPTFVADGIVGIEDIPEGDPQQATDEAYAAAVAGRASLEPAAVLDVATMASDDVVRVQVWATPRADLSREDLHLWMALVEDPVHFAPPPALSNGIVDHPFTLRALHDAGPVQLVDEAVEAGHAFPLNATWDQERLFVAVWLQQGAGFGHRFDAHEAVQATMHPLLRDGITRQATKGVLVEAYSATWCPPCLYGDRAVERLARDHDVPVVRDAAPRASYFQAPDAAWLIALAAVAGGLVVAAYPRGRP